LICDFCSGKTKKRLVTKHHVYKGRLYIVENVTAEVCQDCGERFYHATTLDAIDLLLTGKHKVKRKLQVEVVTL
jgi:YgiT-type zinc finger domain-containing protein